NDLLGRLEGSFERERRFSADLAHELRTPLAELRALAEVELEWAKGEEAEKHRETLNIALQMEALVTRLLELSRCDQGKIPFQLQPVPLAPLTREVLRSLATKADTKQVAIDLKISEEAAFAADPTLLRSILTNLFVNAIEYAPQHGMVSIGWRSEQGELTV